MFEDRKYKTNQRALYIYLNDVVCGQMEKLLYLAGSFFFNLHRRHESVIERASVSFMNTRKSVEAYITWGSQKNRSGSEHLATRVKRLKGKKGKSPTVWDEETRHLQTRHVHLGARDPRAEGSEESQGFEKRWYYFKELVTPEITFIKTVASSVHVSIFSLDTRF